MSVNSEVYAYASGRFNSRVRRGECWDLAEAALEAAHGKTSNDLGVVTADSDYVWGTPITNDSQLIAGDILQFRDFSYVVRREEPNGSWREQNASFTHHTAIVESRNEHGEITVLHQNFARTRKVRRDIIFVSAQSFVQNGTHITVTVSGRIWMYRPIAQTREVQ